MMHRPLPTASPRPAPIETTRLRGSVAPAGLAVAATRPRMMRRPLPTASPRPDLRFARRAVKRSPRVETKGPTLRDGRLLPRELERDLLVLGLGRRRLLGRRRRRLERIRKLGQRERRQREACWLRLGLRRHQAHLFFQSGLAVPAPIELRVKVTSRAGEHKAGRNEHKAGANEHKAGGQRARFPLGRAYFASSSEYDSSSSRRRST